MGNAISKPFVERNDYWYYTINCKDEDISDFYIGSTVKWCDRKRSHKSKCNNGSTATVYRYINEYGGWNNWSMDEICFQKHLTKLEARIIEDILIDEFGTLNEITAYQSLEDWNKCNVERRKSARHNKRLNQQK